LTAGDTSILVRAHRSDLPQILTLDRDFHRFPNLQVVSLEESDSR